MARIRRDRISTQLFLFLLLATGCDSRDQRLAEFSERAAARQQQQNTTIARQSEAVIQENQRIAEAAKALVTADAAARQELIRAQRDSQAELSAERSRIDVQRDALERERQDIAAERRSAPIIAEAIQGVSLVIGCLLPLVLAGYALYRLDRGDPQDEDVTEILLQELAGKNHPLIAPETAPALEDRAKQTGLQRRSESCD